tara:strand:+ start:206 stop:838 length:633 start_codon:yes stop_codon:yes gene_type:complete
MITEYKNILTTEDTKYIGENKVQDSKGRFYEDGISQLNEEPTKELFFDQLFDDVEYEVPYYDLGVDNGIITNRRTKLDALVDGYKAFEYKKTHILYNNGGYNEYCLKSLLSPLASENFINPNNGHSVANQSVVGDIEKLLMLPDKYELNILFELWYGGGYTSESYLDMLDTLIDKHYITEKTITTYTDSIHPILTECDIVHYKIIGRKRK